MDNIRVKKLMGDTPHMSLDQANRLTAFMAEHVVQNVLELGFAHGVSTCYMAAALARFGSGSIVTIDLESARQQEPNIEELLARVGQSGRVTVYYEPSSYTWRLMKFLKEERCPAFDLCYIDGAHTWFVDGLAFCLVHLLLKPGGWIIFDDLDWTHATSVWAHTGKVRRMPEDERTTPQVRMIYELLVKSHPQYHNFRVEHGWGYAQKQCDAVNESREREVVTEKVIQVERVYFGLGEFLMRCAKRLLRSSRPNAEHPLSPTL